MLNIKFSSGSNFDVHSGGVFRETSSSRNNDGTGEEVPGGGEGSEV